MWISAQDITLKIHCEKAIDAEHLKTELGKYSGVEIHPYDGSAVGALKKCWHELKSDHAHASEKLKEIVKLPVELMLALTLNCMDVKDISKEDRWVWCFGGAMVWLGIFSYLMVAAAGAVHDYFGVPESILGITVCALGTSFPNAVASIMMAQEGKSARAISNALGSNVQNVFLAMAFPWVLVTCLPILTPEWGADFAMPEAGIKEGVVWMLGTEFFLIAFVLVGGCTLNAIAGYGMILLYLAYLAFTIGESIGLISAKPHTS